MMSYRRDLQEVIGVTSRLELGAGKTPTPPKGRKGGKGPRSKGGEGVPVQYRNTRNLAPLKTPRHVQDLPPRCATPARGHNLDEVMVHIDTDFVSEWLVRANQSVTEMQLWWCRDDNGVKFSHFWLSVFSDDRRKGLLEMEYDLLVEEIRPAFRGDGRGPSLVTNAHLEKLMRSVVREYPTQFGHSDDGTPFLDMAWVLATKGRPGQYRDLLSDVKCSSHNTLYGQWLLAMRSFALITMVTAVTGFYQRFSEMEEESASSFSRPGTGAGVRPGTTSGARPGTSSGRRPGTSAGARTADPTTESAFAAAKLGFGDVIFYMLSRGMVMPDVVDGLGRTLIFVAVTHRKLDVTKFILENASLFDIDKPAKAGNTPLHAAVNNGDTEMATLLIDAGADASVKNPTSGATPRMIAEMLDHQALLTILPC